MEINPIPASKDDPNYWRNVKDFAVAAFSAAIGDPEALKTVVDVLTNASCNGMEHLDLGDKQKEDIKKEIESSMNNGADGIISALTNFQKASQEANLRLRAKYGRQSSPKKQP
ncbi:MAG: hypothetical protein AAB383_05630 [Patescibacteria group bacterium]